MRRSTSIVGVVAVLATAACSAPGPIGPSTPPPPPDVRTSGWTGWWGSVTVSAVPSATGGGRSPSGCREVSIPSDVLFAENSAQPGDALTLRKVIEVASSVARTVPGPIRVVGYTDNQGAQNLPLSRQRGQAVANALVKAGVERTRIQVLGLGDADPVASNSTASGRAQNRRVEVSVGSCPGAA